MRLTLLLLLACSTILCINAASDIQKERKLSRNLVQGKATKWPNQTIPFQLREDFTSSERNIIMSSMETITNSTGGCLQWIRRTNETDFVHFNTGKKGCFSTLGYIKGNGAHEVHIQQIGFKSSCMRKGIILSLMMKILGFGAENNRPDRDDHLNVLWENIRETDRHRFLKYRGMNEPLSHVSDCSDEAIIVRHGDCVQGMKVDTLGLQYDFGSITHFGLYYYSKNTRPTLQTKGNVSQDLVIGQRDSLSDLDIKKLTTVYCSHAPAPDCVDSTGLCVVLKLGCYFNYVKRTCPKSCNACNLVVKDALSPK